MSRPNLLLIVSDQHNPLISGYAGNAFVRTPNLDRLAANGASFSHAVCSCPVCGPSRASYMTGKYVHQIETWWNRVPLDTKEMTWARRLDQVGVPSTLLGKIDVARPQENPGFTNCKLSMHRDRFEPYPLTKPKPTMRFGETRPASRAYLDQAGSFDPAATPPRGSGYEPAHGLYYQDKRVLDWTKAFLRERGAERHGSERDAAPWALHVGFEYPHWPYVAPDKYFSMYYPDAVEFPYDAVFPMNEKLPEALQEWQRWNDFGGVSEETLRRVLAAYYGMVTCMDDMIGEILEELEANGFADNTLIMYTSDHGESLGEHGLFFKHSPVRAAVGVPLVLAGTGIRQTGSVDTPVSLVDLYPTILDAYGLEAEEDRPGASLLRILDEGAEGARAREAKQEQGVFAEWHGPGFRGAWYMLGRLPYKYVWYESFPPTLHDIVNDPTEDHNLADDPDYAEVLTDFEGELRSRLDLEAVSLQAKHDLGLIGKDGTDLTQEPQKQ